MADKSEPKHMHLPVVRNCRYLRMDAEGNYVPTEGTSVTKKQTLDMLTSMSVAPYQMRTDPKTGQPYDDELQYAGWTEAQVISHRVVRGASGGDLQFIQLYYDRVMGKATQYSEVLAVSGTFQDFLDSIAEREGIAANRTAAYDADAEVVDVSDVGSWL